jgi:hypothetical protein
MGPAIRNTEAGSSGKMANPDNAAPPENAEGKEAS